MRLVIQKFRFRFLKTSFLNQLIARVLNRLITGTLLFRGKYWAKNKKNINPRVRKCLTIEYTFSGFFAPEMPIPVEGRGIR